MATVTFIEKTCAVCGTVGNYSEMATVSIAVPVGIDGHPGEVKPLIASLNYCHECGYSAEDVEYGNTNIATIVFSDGYKNLIKNTKISESVRKFMAAALIQKHLGFTSTAARLMMGACWVAESLSESDNLISRLRNYTLELMLEAQEKGDSFEMSIFHEAQVIVELYRREGEFEDALDICRAALEAEKIATNIKELLQYEEYLCMQMDDSPRTMRDMQDYFRSLKQ